MSTIEQVKLSNAGDELVLLIEKAELVPVGRYPEYSFIGQDGDRDVDLRVPKASADRQLTRLGLSIEQTVGKTLRFSRGENKTDASKPYWNVDVVSGANGTGRPASAGAAAVRQSPRVETGAAATPPSRAATKADVQSIFDAEPTGEAKKSGYALYKQITERVLSEMPKLYATHGIEIDAQTVAAISATVFIQASRNGH